MLRFKNIIMMGILIIMSVFANAQMDKVSAAYSLLQKGSLDSAKALIDLAVADTEIVNDGQAWYLKGFIYKEIYKKREITNKQSPIRIEALNAFKRSLFIDTSVANVEENKKNIIYLTTTLYNDAASCLDSINYKIAIDNFEKYKTFYKIIDSTRANIKLNDIKFLLAIASVYVQIYESDKKGKSEFLELAKGSYNKVLALDHNNISANYNMGILFYNQAVQLINQSDFDIDIVALNDIQDNSIKLFKESLPFLLNAEQQDPKRRETLLGLSGVYFSLNEKEKSDLYRQKLQELEKKK